MPSAKLIYLSTDKNAGIAALKKPQFIIADPRPGKPTRYYLTMAVWEYDPAKATTAVQTSGCAVVEAAFKAARKSLVAKRLGSPPGGGPTQTDPAPGSN